MILTLLVIITSTSISAAIIDYAAHNTVIRHVANDKKKAKERY